jgi:hypothetical protein
MVSQWMAYSFPNTATMKRILLTASVLINLVLIISADFPKPAVAESQRIEASRTKTKMCGYTILEFGKGVDCHGDTIQLAKRNGIYVRVKK